MKRKLFSLLTVTAAIMASAQWSKVMPPKEVVKKSDNSVYYKLDIDKIRTQLLAAPKYGEGSGITVNIPTLNGKIEKFTVNSLPVVDEALAGQYQLGSYVGTGVDDPAKYIRFSVAPNDFQSMIINNGKYEFIEPATQDKSAYSIHGKSSKNGHAFTCSTKESKESVAKMQQMMASGAAAKSSDKKYHTLRLAMSVTGEYTTYFGGTANALAQINATLTRVNGVFEQEFNLHLNMVSAPNLIFTTAASDPYSNASQMCKWNYELMNTLHNGAYGVTDASFDIGHLFGRTGGGGNAGCIGCIGSNDVSTTTYSAANGGCGYSYTAPNNYKGSGITSPADGIPMSDTFDIDYVAHEIGHQLGDSHTYSFFEDFMGTEVEPGSGSTIMGYAGITGPATDLQDHSDPYFHSVSIDQVQANLAAVTVDVETPIANNTPVVAAMPTTYTIPRSTAFVLTASATDPDGDALTYNWEQMDACILDDGIDNTNIGNETSGAIFRSWPAVSTPTRYFPKLATVLGGAVANTLDFESASNVERTTHFRVTVRDNKPAGQAQTAYATQTIVVGSAAAFTVNTTSLSPNTNSTVAWTVSGTTAAPYNVANVKIDYTFDGGTTWTVLAASVPNTGSASVFIPAALAGKNGHIRVSAIGNVFYAVKQATVSALATSEVDGVRTIQVYPNPVDDILNVSNASSKSPYEIYNAVGQLISKGTLGDGKIVVRNLVKGVYFININEKGTDIKTKFVKK
ncbi:Por secretion system C-terminal sorting domain-containing protein [Chryseobacterium soldanellicola]|uniref:Por secretion system C-terminal sorting domain-containing protein n=1 Tax=Chryseobacterium soldanellicola TaxID=311333 RepID=A0A1H1A288_9FLAO|nr:zinc-dependent metalloprotease [Chryseobacterium soldanellicola]SDQ33758.1 Por secretion system C-terminal sorting domain-containing protein [Chryseobacterium soldanellicola]